MSCPWIFWQINEINIINIYIYTLYELHARVLPNRSSPGDSGKLPEFNGRVPLWAGGDTKFQANTHHPSDSSLILYYRLADEPVGKHISLEHLELMPAVQHLLKVPIPEHFILSNPCSAPTSPSRSIKPSRITCYVHFPNTFLLDLWRFKIVTTQSVFFTAKSSCKSNCGRYSSWTKVA